MKKIFLVSLGLTILSGCVTTPSEQLVTVLNTGKFYETAIKIPSINVDIPLPAGKWKLIGWSTDYNNHQTPFLNAVLVQGKTQKPSKFIWVNMSVGYVTNGYVPSKFCERKDIHYIKKIANYGGSDQDCWGINHYRIAVQGRMPKHMKQVRNYINENKVDIPLNTIYVHYRKANTNKLIDFSYHFNPEADGFDKPKIAAWSSSDWHPTRIVTSPDKLAYISNIKDWAEKFKSKVDAGFAGKLITQQPHPLKTSPP